MLLTSAAFCAKLYRLCSTRIRARARSEPCAFGGGGGGDIVGNRDFTSRDRWAPKRASREALLGPLKCAKRKI